jgi:HD superfamily phosphodiesterase
MRRDIKYQKELLKLIKGESKKIIKEVNDPLHNWRHVKRTVTFAKKLLKYYPEANEFVTEVAAYLHDVGIINGRDKHNKKSAKIAEELLRENNCNEDIIKEIKESIEDHCVGSKPRTLEGRIIRDADHLDWSDIDRMKTFKNRKELHKEVIPIWWDLENKILELPESKRIFKKNMKKHLKWFRKEFPEFRNKKYD